MQINAGVSTDTNMVDTNKHIVRSEKAHSIGEVMEKGQKQSNLKATGSMSKRAYTEDELMEAIDIVNEEFVIYDRRCEFAIHEKTRQIMVKVIDTVTDDIIREIPPEKILDALADRWKLSGILVDERI